jgi:Ca-activated chloride channel family protein
MRTLTLVLVMFGAMTMVAQDTTAVKRPMDYFNLAAKQYVKEDKMSALRTLDQGLQQHPQDARLRKLATELLKEQQQQQQQQQQQEQDKPEDGRSKEEQSKGAQEQQKQEQQAEQQQSEQSKERKPGDPGQPRPGEIAPQDAKRILDALDRQEQQVQSRMRQRQQPAPKVPVDKDW